MDPNLLSAVILAGGRSSRMGRPKAWLPVDGVPMLVHVAARVRPLVSEIVVVAAPGQDLPALEGLGPVRVVSDRVEDEGPLPALALGLVTIARPYAIALGCDAPLVRLELLRFLAEACERADADAAIPRWNDRLQPLVAAYHRRLASRLQALAASGERRLQTLAHLERIRLVDADELRAIDPDGRSFTPVNTPLEFAAIAPTRTVESRATKPLESASMNPVPELAFESTTPLSQAEFAAWIRDRHDSHLNHYELLDGKVVMTPPAGYPHGNIGAAIGGVITPFVWARTLGTCLDSSQGFELPSGDTVEPDFSFVSQERWSAMLPPRRGEFLKVVPDLVVEILSRSTERRDREQKRKSYDRNGVREYWIIDPERRALVVFTRGDGAFDAGVTFAAGSTFRSRVLPGFELDVALVLG